jgi:hypothetical protein
MVDPAEAAEIDTILECCGFTDQARRADIAADGFESHGDVNTLTEKDIGSLAKGFTTKWNDTDPLPVCVYLDGGVCR